MTKSEILQEAIDLRNALLAVRDLIDDVLASSSEIELEDVDTVDDAEDDEHETEV